MKKLLEMAFYGIIGLTTLFFLAVLIFVPAYDRDDFIPLGVGSFFAVATMCLLVAMPSILRRLNRNPYYDGQLGQMYGDINLQRHIVQSLRAELSEKQDEMDKCLEQSGSYYQWAQERITSMQEVIDDLYATAPPSEESLAKLQKEMDNLKDWLGRQQSKITDVDNRIDRVTGLYTELDKKYYG